MLEKSEDGNERAPLMQHLKLNDVGSRSLVRELGRVPQAAPGVLSIRSIEGRPARSMIGSCSCPPQLMSKLDNPSMHEVEGFQAHIQSVAIVLSCRLSATIRSASSNNRFKI